MTKLFDVYVKTGELWGGPWVMDADALKTGAALPVEVKNGHCQVLLYHHDALTGLSETRRIDQLERDRAVRYPKKPFQTIPLLNGVELLQTDWDPPARLATVRVPFRKSINRESPVTCFVKIGRCWDLAPVPVVHDGRGFIAKDLPVGSYAFLLFEGAVSRSLEELLQLDHLASRITVFDVERETTTSFTPGEMQGDDPVFALNENVPEELNTESFTLLGGGHVLTEHDTAEEIEQVVYVPLKKGATNADLDSMGLAVEDNMKTFRSTTATESFFADMVDPEELGDDFELAWLQAPKTDQSAHDLFFADF